jgi:hypothetical protein
MIAFQYYDAPQQVLRYCRALAAVYFLENSRFLRNSGINFPSRVWHDYCVKNGSGKELSYEREGG